MESLQYNLSLLVLNLFVFVKRDLIKLGKAKATWRLQLYVVDFWCV